MRERSTSSSATSDSTRWSGSTGWERAGSRLPAGGPWLAHAHAALDAAVAAAYGWPVDTSDNDAESAAHVTGSGGSRRPADRYAR